MDAPIKHKSIIASPLLERIDLSPYLDDSIEEVATGGESGVNARVCDYDWILDMRGQCVERGIPFRFHQTGAFFRKDGKLYGIKRRYQLSQAHKAGIDYKIGKYYIPETVNRKMLNGITETNEEDGVQLEVELPGIPVGSKKPLIR